jgi:prophage antirepressor-like protein
LEQITFVYMELQMNHGFCGKDVATTLGYKDTINAIKTHIELKIKIFE